jgi:hypothetical protein
MIFERAKIFLRFVSRKKISGSYIKHFFPKNFGPIKVLLDGKFKVVDLSNRTQFEFSKKYPNFNVI